MTSLIDQSASESSADGNYEVTLMTKATVHANGRVLWEPPAVYKSSCEINVEFFPFDEQLCVMKFGSWTYDGFQVALQHMDEQGGNNTAVIERGIDLKSFYRSVEWDLLEVPARLSEVDYPCCREPFLDITFNLTMRRKTLFHTVNLIIPCVAISFLTLLVFYLPSESGEKITLCISILLSLTVFILMLAEIIPPTSLVIPLIGKYLLFTMTLVTLSIIVTVIVLNVHFRSPSTHKMSDWVKQVFLNVLPRLLLMRRPAPVRAQHAKVVVATCNGEVEIVSSFGGHRRPNWLLDDLGSFSSLIHDSDTDDAQSDSELGLNLKQVKVGPENETSRAFIGITYIAEHLKVEDNATNIKEDWKYVALVLDRLFLWIFSTACLLGMCGIMLQAPTPYDTRQPLEIDVGTSV